MSTITTRGYVKREGKALVPTQLGEVTNDIMLRNFATIVDAVREGRGIYANIRKVVGFLLGYFLTEGLMSEGWRYAAAVIAAAVFFLPSVFYDRQTKKDGSLTYTILRLF